MDCRIDNHVLDQFESLIHRQVVIRSEEGFYPLEDCRKNEWNTVEVFVQVSCTTSFAGTQTLKAIKEQLTAWVVDPSAQEFAAANVSDARPGRLLLSYIFRLRKRTMWSVNLAKFQTLFTHILFDSQKRQHTNDCASLMSRSCFFKFFNSFHLNFLPPSDR